MHATAPDNTDSPQAAVRRTVGMPRQYGVRTMLVITTLYAVLFAFLASLKAHPFFFVAPGIFLAGIGLTQMFVFKGTRPREASLLAGSCLLAAGAATGVVLMHCAGEPGDGVLLWMVVFTPGVGAALGYLVGVAIAGPFLVAEWPKRRRQTTNLAPQGQRHPPKP
jgi:hypothetical protein